MVLCTAYARIMPAYARIVPDYARIMPGSRGVAQNKGYNKKEYTNYVAIFL